MTDTAVDASSPVVGSSRNKTDGDIINSIPILVRLRSPPEIPRMNSFPTCDRQINDTLSKSKSFLLVTFFFFTFQQLDYGLKISMRLTAESTGVAEPQ